MALSKKKQTRKSWREWKKGDSHLINRIKWDQREVDAVGEVFGDDWFASGKVNRAFESRLADYTGILHIHGTNSGSAAIQTGLLALKEQGYWQPGDMVLHPVTTFATSISSAIFLGMTPVYVDTKPNTYVADPEQVKKAIKKYPQTKGMILPYLLGNVPDIDSIKDSLDDRFLVEDSCDTLGGKYNGIHLGSFGQIAAFSFYASHHITSGGVGGAVGTMNRSLDYLLKSIIYWGRDFKDGDDEFLKRYNYATIGTDSQLSSVQAAFGLAQMDKLNQFVNERAKQFAEMTELFRRYKHFNLPETEPKAEPSWFAYPLTVKSSSPFTRADLVRYLTANRVEVRPIMCGNITEQKPFRQNKYISIGNFPVGREIENNGLFVPCWGMSEEQKKDYYEILEGFLSGHKTNKKTG